jgi:hypothetical protein
MNLLTLLENKDQSLSAFLTKTGFGIRRLRVLAQKLPKAEIVVAFFSTLGPRTLWRKNNIFLIGRNRLCDININDPHISRLQLTIIATPSDLHLFHTSTTSFNIVNQKQIMNEMNNHFIFPINERIIIECGPAKMYRFIINPQLCPLCHEPFGTCTLPCKHPFCLTCALRGKGSKCVLCD